MTNRVHTRPVLSYFICCTPRSGSFLLCEALMNTGLAGHPDEYIVSLLSPWREDFTLEDYRAALQPILDRGTVSGIFGSKVIWFWFRDFVEKLSRLARRERADVTDLIAELFPNPHFIMLVRRDKVRQAISLKRASWTRVWRSTEARYQRRAVEDLTIDPTLIDVQVWGLQQAERGFQQFFEERDIRPFPVVYEDFVGRYEETAVEVLDFLGIAHPPKMQFGPRILHKQWDSASDALLTQYYASKGTTPVLL